jgi:hypothetical protein
MEGFSGIFSQLEDPGTGNARRHDLCEVLVIALCSCEEARAYLQTIFPSADGSCFECTPEEGAKAFLHRFVTAGAPSVIARSTGRMLKTL